LDIRAPYIRKHAETLQLSSNYVVRLQIGHEEGTNERKRRRRESLSWLSLNLSGASSSCHGMAWHSLCVRSSAYDFSQAVVRPEWELCSGAATTTAGLRDPLDSVSWNARSLPAGVHTRVCDLVVDVRLAAV
jgi:hypothetical protein